jgi:hypothetical protein
LSITSAVSNFSISSFRLQTPNSAPSFVSPQNAVNNRKLNSSSHILYLAVPMNFRTLLANPSATIRMAWLFASSLVRSRTIPKDTKEMTSFCLFIGYPRTGHTLVSSIIDAHPDAIISRKPASVGLVPHFSGNQIVELCLRNSKKVATNINTKMKYEYNIPGQWQGRYRNIKVVGNRNAPVTLDAFSHSPGLHKQLKNKLGSNIRFIHVVRDPFDTISRIEIQNKLSFEDAASWFLSLCKQYSDFSNRLPEQDQLIHTIHLEDLISDPKLEISTMLNFLELEVDEEFLSACASIIWSKPSKTREKRAWTAKDRDLVNNISSQFDFLQHYIN